MISLLAATVGAAADSCRAATHDCSLAKPPSTRNSPRITTPEGVPAKLGTLATSTSQGPLRISPGCCLSVELLFHYVGGDGESQDGMQKVFSGMRLCLGEVTRQQ